MRIWLSLCFLFAVNVWAQVAQPTVTLETALDANAVVATVDGAKITYGELQSVLRSLPPQNAQALMKDRKRFVEQYALMKRLAAAAEKEKLDEKTPYKEALAHNRMQLLSQAEINEKAATIRITPEEVQKFYDGNKDRFTQAQVKVIYVSFTATPPAQTNPKAKKILNEAEAKAKVEGILKQIRGGADFVKLVKENSDDPTSAAKDGDFGLIRKSDKIPEAIKSVIFALKPGDVSEPVRQPNGFYMFRLEQITEEPMEKAKETIAGELKNKQLTDWISTMQSGIELKIENQAFFTPQTMPLQMPEPPKAAPAKPSTK